LWTSRAAGKHQDGLAGGEKGGAVLARSEDGAAAGQDPAPERDREVEVVGQSPHSHPAFHLEAADERGQVLHEEQLVVSHQHERPLRWHVLDVDEGRLREPVGGVDDAVHHAGDAGGREREFSRGHRVPRQPWPRQGM
jgi:hypothetical protein